MCHADECRNSYYVWIILDRDFEYPQDVALNIETNKKIMPYATSLVIPLCRWHFLDFDAGNCIDLRNGYELLKLGQEAEIILPPLTSLEEAVKLWHLPLTCRAIRVVHSLSATSLCFRYFTKFFR